MTKDEIFIAIKKATLDVLPLVNEHDISADKQLFDLGANSIDRSEIVINTMQSLGLKVSPSELGKVKNIQGLIDALYDAASGR